MSMSQASALFYGAFLNTEEHQAADIARQLIDRGVFSDDEALDCAMDDVHLFGAEFRAKYTAPITTEHGITYPHLYLVNGQPWDDSPLYFIGYPMDSKAMDLEEQLHPGIQTAVEAEIAQFAVESGFEITPEVQLVTSWG